ncbi:MAG: EamA family transporter, partial [Enterobacteriaceae bacterium]
MSLLLITTLIWSFSFSLIGVYLAGSVDSWFAVWMRILLAFMVFIPWCRWRGFSFWQLVCYMSVGACQLGIMYFFYYAAFLYLTVAELLLFTVFTPVYITLIYDLLSGKVPRWSYLLTALLAVAGATVIRYQRP